MAQDKTKQTMTDPMLEGTGQPGELADTPTVPSDMQDPALVGTGQPGELMGTPETPDPGFVQEVMKQKKTNEQQIENLAKKRALLDVGMSFNMFDIADDLGLQFNEFDKKGKK